MTLNLIHRYLEVVLEMLIRTRTRMVKYLGVMLFQLAVALFANSVQAELVEYKYTGIIENKYSSGLFPEGEKVDITLTFDGGSMIQTGSGTSNGVLTNILYNDQNPLSKLTYVIAGETYEAEGELIVLVSSPQGYTFQGVDYPNIGLYLHLDNFNAEENLEAPQSLASLNRFDHARFSIRLNGEESDGYLEQQNMSCFGGASYPESWTSLAGATCGQYGCNMGYKTQEQCVNFADDLGALQYIWGVSNGPRANECWLQTSCSDLRPSNAFTFRPQPREWNEHTLVVKMRTSDIRYADSDTNVWLKYESNDGEVLRFLAATSHIDDYELSPGLYEYFIRVNSDDFSVGTFTELLTGKWQWQAEGHDGYIASEFQIEELSNKGDAIGCVSIAGLTNYWVDKDSTTGELVMEENANGVLVEMRTTPWVQASTATPCN